MIAFVPAGSLNIVLRNLMRSHFGLVRIRSIFHAADDSSLERLPFFEQLLCALRIDDGRDCLGCARRSQEWKCPEGLQLPHRRAFPDLSVSVKRSRRFGSFFAQPPLHGLSSFCVKPCFSQACFSRVYFSPLLFLSQRASLSAYPSWRLSAFASSGSFSDSFFLCSSPHSTTGTPTIVRTATAGRFSRREPICARTGVCNMLASAPWRKVVSMKKDEVRAHRRDRHYSSTPPGF